ncbi:MAG: hypothetical protein PVH88_05060 [Ignavibacteria bacterium]|jgi:hypothetical protein
MINKKLKNLLYKSFDSHLNDSEKRLLTHELLTNPELSKEKDRIEKLRLQLSSIKHPDFDKSFLDRVILSTKTKAVYEYEEFFELIMFLFKRVAISAAAIILILLTIELTQTESIDKIFGQSTVSIEDFSNPIYYFDQELK